MLPSKQQLLVTPRSSTRLAVAVAVLVTVSVANITNRIIPGVHAFPISTGHTVADRSDPLAVVQDKSSTSTSSSNDSLSIPTILAQVADDHAKEFDRGVALFGGGTSNDSHVWAWRDDDFVSYPIAGGQTGPDAAVLGDKSDSVHQTAEPILTPDECDALVLEAKQVIREGLFRKETEQNEKQREQPTNSQLGEARASQLPVAREWLSHVLHTRFFPLLESRFGVSRQDLTLQDALVIGYGYVPPQARQTVKGGEEKDDSMTSDSETKVSNSSNSGGGGAPSQPIHRDSCILSLNVALSDMDNYDGGGTFFEGLPPRENNSNCHSGVVSSPRGHAVCHAGGASHAGRGIRDGGQRWVLVLFCLVRDQPELARRCHARGMEEQDQGRLAEAQQTFQAGLTVAPRDHLLRTSLGSTYQALDPQCSAAALRARACLSQAARHYQHCPKANMALGHMMLANRKPRAALRRYDAVLQWLDDRDLLYEGADETTMATTAATGWEPYQFLGFDARGCAARAGLLCAREAKSRGMANFPWRDRLEEAQDRCRKALQYSPDDPRIRSYLAFAQTIREDADEKQEL